MRTNPEIAKAKSETLKALADAERGCRNAARSIRECGGLKRDENGGAEDAGLRRLPLPMVWPTPRRPPRLLIGAKEPATKTLEGGLKWWPGANGSRPLHLSSDYRAAGFLLAPPSCGTKTTRALPRVVSKLVKGGELIDAKAIQEDLRIALPDRLVRVRGGDTPSSPTRCRTTTTRLRSHPCAVTLSQSRRCALLLFKPIHSDLWPDCNRSTLLTTKPLRFGRIPADAMLLSMSFR